MMNDEEIKELKYKLMELPEGFNGVLFINASNLSHEQLRQLCGNKAVKNINLPIIMCHNVDAIKLIEWPKTETQKIQNDKELMKEIRQGVKKLKEGDKRYSFEDIFGEPLEG